MSVVSQLPSIALNQILLYKSMPDVSLGDPKTLEHNNDLVIGEELVAACENFSAGCAKARKTEKRSRMFYRIRKSHMVTYYRMSVKSTWTSRCVI